jgi:hypothetical protein
MGKVVCLVGRFAIAHTYSLILFSEAEPSNTGDFVSGIQDSDAVKA